MILKGNVAYELIRPLNLYWLWFSRELANRTAPTTLRSIPIFVLSLLFFGLQPPTSILSAFGFIISIILAIFLSSSISIIVNISLMWTISGEGVSQILPAIVWIFSGIIIPLPLFPDSVQPILNFLPFRGIMDTPFRLYMGHIPPDQLLNVISHQLIWIVILIALGRWILNRGLKRLVIQGG
jgi:ABC-2 type transport system permease protein